MDIKVSYANIHLQIFSQSPWTIHSLMVDYMVRILLHSFLAEIEVVVLIGNDTPESGYATQIYLELNKATAQIQCCHQTQTIINMRFNRQLFS